MICFITDIREGETDILSPLRALPLRIKTLEGHLIGEVEPPGEGWTHEKLVEQGEIFDIRTRTGADAFLGTEWVGSTEV